MNNVSWTVPNRAVPCQVIIITRYKDQTSPKDLWRKCSRVLAYNRCLIERVKAIGTRSIYGEGGFCRSHCWQGDSQSIAETFCKESPRPVVILQPEISISTSQILGPGANGLAEGEIQVYLASLQRSPQAM